MFENRAGVDVFSFGLCGVMVWDVFVDISGAMISWVVCVVHWVIWLSMDGSGVSCGSSMS